MTIEVQADLVRLSGRCGTEEAEALLTALASGVQTVDLSGCEHLHAAIVQLLMAAQPAIAGEPSSFLARWILPLIGSRQGSGGDGKES